MIFYRVLGKPAYKSHWRKIAGASNLREGVAYVEQNQRTIAIRGVDSWEVGCSVPPGDTPQARRSGSFSK